MLISTLYEKMLMNFGSMIVLNATNKMHNIEVESQSEMFCLDVVLVLFLVACVLRLALRRDS